MRIATRAISCLPPPATSSISCAFRWVNLTKAETRALADEFDLPVAAKPDSQDICFVPEGRYAGVVERLRPGAAEPGEIRHVDGRLLGRHEGVIHFTIGQRRGTGIAGAEPLYVVKLDAARRQVVVGPRGALACAGASLREINWLAADAMRADGADVEVKLRSASPAVPARIFADGNRALWRTAARRGAGSGLRLLSRRAG